MRTNRIIIALLFLLTCVQWSKAEGDSHWQCNIHDYEYDMSVFFELQLDGVPITDYSGYEVAAFVDDECRGIADIQTATKKDGTKVQYGYLRIRSNNTDGETVSFVVYHTPTNNTYYSSETMSFKNLEREGFPSSPFIINIKDLEVEDVDGDGKTNETDVAFLLEKERQKALADGLVQDGDSNSCQQLVDKAKQDIDDTAFDTTKTFEENKASLHDVVTQLENSLETQRINDFNDYKNEQKSVADALAEDGDSEKSLQLIATAKAQIDAITYDQTKTPAENKLAVDAIIEKLKTDLKAQRDAEAADKQSLDAYKKEKKDEIDALALDDDSKACKELVSNAKKTVDVTAYDNNKTLEDNKAAIDAIVDKVKDDLASKRAAEEADKAALEEYKTEQKTVADGLMLDDDSKASKKLVEDAQTAIEAVAYDKNKTLDENKVSVDAIINKLKDDLAAKRAAEAADKQALDDYKKEQKQVADAQAGYGDSDACRQIITDAKSAIETVTYDNNKTLDENKASVDAIINKLKEDLSKQRNFERAIYVYDYNGVYDEKSHGIYVNVPEGAYVKYGESAGNYWFYDSPVYSNAGTYIVYYEVNKEGLLPMRGSAMVTIEKATLTSVTLEKTELIYDTFGQQPQTVKITSVKAGSLDVPSDAYVVEGDTETEIGNYTVKITAKYNSNFTGVITANYTIVKEDITIDNGGEDKDVKLNVTVLDPEAKTLRIDNLVVPNGDNSITIPSQINGFDVVEIADGAMDDDASITDVYLPDTKKAINIGMKALPSTAHIHSPLPLLDDYALMTSLKPNYEAVKISAEALPQNKYWTFSCGVDVILPEGLTLYICKSHNNDGVIILELKDRIVKANNGVLIASDDNYVGKAFEITARPSADRPSGMTPPTGNAKSYDGNELCPVIEEQHYNPSDWYILAGNEFHELQIDDNSMVPACKAILPRKNSNQARTLSLYSDGEATKIGNVDAKNDNANGKWYDLQGRILDRKPTKAGLYLNNGKKVVIK